MKKILFLLFVLANVAVLAQNSSPAFSSSQSIATYAFVNGDPKFMVLNAAKNADGSGDAYVLKPGLPDGSYTIFYDAAQTKVFQKGFLENGHRIKSWAYYTEAQTPKMEMEYDASGLLSGIVKEYYPSGKLKTETQFRNGQANGMLVSYYESGIKKMQCGMKNNNMDGKAIYYDEAGKMTQATTIQYGEGGK